MSILRKISNPNSQATELSTTSNIRFERNKPLKEKGKISAAITDEAISLQTIWHVYAKRHRTPKALKTCLSSMRCYLLLRPYDCIPYRPPHKLYLLLVTSD